MKFDRPETIPPKFKVNHRTKNILSLGYQTAEINYNIVRRSCKPKEGWEIDIVELVPKR